MRTSRLVLVRSLYLPVALLFAITHLTTCTPAESSAHSAGSPVGGARALPGRRAHLKKVYSSERHKPCRSQDLGERIRLPRQREQDGHEHFGDRRLKRHDLEQQQQQQQQQQGDDCKALRDPAVHGLRCDDASAQVSDNMLVLRANEATWLILIGRNLNKNVSVALTVESGFARQDCTHSDRVRTLRLHEISSSVARALVNVPAPANGAPYYVCVRDAYDRWIHQGDDALLTLHVRDDWLPLHMKVVLVACLLMLSGLFSGLNLGLMALDKNELQVIISCGSETEKRYARAIEPVRRRGNYLLCSILFSNVLVNSTIAVLLEELTSGIVAVMTSTIFIVMFGEILPQAFCSRHGLAVGAKTVSITYFCMIVTFPLSYPISSCLDWALGEEIGHAYDRERLMEFIRVTRDYNNLETDEVNIISGALKLKRIPVSEVMTRIEDVYMLDLDSSLDFDTIQSIVERGYSRVPVHEPGNNKNIVALLFAKDLALLDPDDRTPVRTLISFYDHPIMYLFEDTTLDLALNEFKTGKSHLAFVRRVVDDGDRDPVYEILGIVTLEDVIEEIMQMEINDETDTVSDNRRKRRRKEAQVRRDFAQFARFGAGESSDSVATPQLCLAAYQYLATTVEPFSPQHISDAILKRLMSQKIYFSVKVNDSARDERRLYIAGKPADYFIMILEGCVHVVCGREGLLFKGGPFSHFGRAALTGAGQLTSGEQHETPPVQTPRNSIGAPESTSAPANCFVVVPDYTVEVVSNTLYLKVTNKEYQAALMATIVERGQTCPSDSPLLAAAATTASAASVTGPVDVPVSEDEADDETLPSMHLMQQSPRGRKPSLGSTFSNNIELLTRKPRDTNR